MRAALTTLSFFVLTLNAINHSAQADGMTITLQGNGHGAPACVTCHGAHGEGIPANGFPRLAGLNTTYLMTQLDAFANGQRINPIMSPIAQTLSKEDRAAVATYYASLNNEATVPVPVAVKNSPGELLATKGRWSKGLPACVQCHGEMGSGVGTAFPALAGQSSVYIENQLRAWQKGTRAPGPLGLMKVIASKLSATDIHEVATYFSTLPPGNHSGRVEP